jgi:hypothetical protein
MEQQKIYLPQMNNWQAVKYHGVPKEQKPKLRCI